MKHVNYEEVKEEIPTEKGAKDITVRWLISDKDGAKNFAMRLFEVKPGGNTPWHQHDWEHEIFVLDGEGMAKGEKGKLKFGAGDVFYVEPMEWHQFVNTGKRGLKFLCLIPYKK